MAFIEDVADKLGVDVIVGPGITSMSPTSVLGMVAETKPVVIEGWGFTPTSFVRFGEMDGIVLTRTSSTQLTVMPPLHLPGKVDVLVGNEHGDWSEPGPKTKFTFEKVI